MRASNTILLCLALAAPLTSALLFSADVRVKVNNGYYDAKFYYYYDESGSGNHAVRYEYSTPTQMTELITYSDHKRYKYCSKCESGFYTNNAPLIFPLASDVATGLNDGAGCYQYDRSSSDEGLKSIWYTSEGKVCKAELKPESNAQANATKTLIFSNIDKTFNDMSKFNMVGKECPAPVCKRVMDLVFVLDTSYSICRDWDDRRPSVCDLQDWVKIQAFTKNIINSFDIANDATMVGIVTFCETSTIVNKLSSNKDTVIKNVEGISEMCSATCIGCGVEGAINVFKDITEERKLMNPERMLIFMTDGGNNRPSGGPYCANYTAKCVSRSPNKCMAYKCAEYECLAYDTSKCAKKKCLSYSSTCARCGTYTDVCTKYSTTCIRNSTTCTKCPSSYCCSISKGACKRSSSSFWCSGVSCSCAEYECAEYGCAEYECDICAEYECATESDDCEEYECTSRGDKCVKEECSEYECLGYELECVSSKSGYDAHLTGILSMLHSGFALGPTHRDIITVAIGVGSEIEPDEVKAVASTLEGQQLYYTLDDYDALTDVMNKLVQDTCTSQDSQLEICSGECLGFCGCEKKCYCPSCDTGDNCTSYSCFTDAEGTTSTGCVAKPATCNPSTECRTVTRDPNTVGCCVEQAKPCPKKDMCSEPRCASNGTCVYEAVECVSDDPCMNATGCDPFTGCTYTPACPDKGKCFTSTCTSANNAFTCQYEPVCDYSDPCVNTTCDEATGTCIYEPVVCTPSNPCMTSVCVNGKCIESVNTTLAFECAAATTNPCEEGFCNQETGKCETREIADADPYCLACFERPINCTQNLCMRSRCASDDNETTYCKVEDDYCVSDDPCVEALCDEVNGCRFVPVACAAGPCEVASCITDPEDSTKHKCVTTSTCPESDACVTYSCAADGKTCVATSNCEEKPCKKIVGCSVEAGKAVCEYEDIVCVSKSKCSNAFCNVETNMCEYEDNSSGCDLGNPCMTYKCDDYDGCKYEPIDCDDDNPCTIDSCVPRDPSASSEPGDPEEGYYCLHEPKCTTESFCSRASCSVVSGECSYNDYNCDDYNKSALDSCHAYECDEESRTCKSVLLVSAFLDVCGGCVKTYGTNATLNITHAKTACIGGMQVPEFAAAIGGAAVAGIVVAAVIVAAAIGASSAMGTRELIKRAKISNEAAMSNNPLYEGNDNEGINPLFEGDM